jgi:hypothetical protein
MYIVGFNGPPESGKDTLAEMLAEHMDKMGVTLPVKMESLSLPLRKIAYSMVGWRGELDGQNYETFKRERFYNLPRRYDSAKPEAKLESYSTGRQLMIDVSERFLKQVYGIDVMARLLLQRNAGFGGILLIRDCGFQCEVDPLESAVGVKNLYMTQVFRADKDFSNDSREWVHTRGKMHQVFNDGTLDDLRVEADRIYGRLVNQCGWKL